MKKLVLVLLFALSFSAFAKEYRLPYAKTNVVFETEDDKLATKITRDRGFIIYTEKEKIVLNPDNVLEVYNNYIKRKRISILKTNSVGEETAIKSKGTATASTRASDSKSDINWEE